MAAAERRPAPQPHRSTRGSTPRPHLNAAQAEIARLPAAARHAAANMLNARTIGHVRLFHRRRPVLARHLRHVATGSVEASSTAARNVAAAADNPAALAQGCGIPTSERHPPVGTRRG
ncbi:MAG: hypothetical protein M3O70_22105 [Actinomycetota bacterium]|nr:hypothetical protein [Actinomycetota bacterium]